MNRSGKKWLPWLPVLLFVAQLLLCFIAFKDFRMAPQQIAFSNINDGMKNNFTLLQYVKEPIGPQGLLHFRSFNFPYGDVVWFTDNTPVFSIPFKVFCQYVYDLSAYTLPIYFLFILLNIPVCALFCYKIMTALTRRPALAFAGAILIPWLMPTILRIPRGHYNLSVSTLVVANLWYLMGWHRRLRTGAPLYPSYLKLTACIFIGFLFHGYYLAIVAAFTGLTLLSYSLFTPSRAYRIQALKAAVLIPAIAGILAVGLVALTDPFRTIRIHEGMGYDWMETKTRFTSLFSPYTFIDTPSPIQGKLYYDEPERAAYLGTGVVMALLGIAGISVFSPAFRQRVRQVWKTLLRNGFAKAVALGGFLMLMIAFGEYYYTTADSDGFFFINLLNPFYYLHKATHQIEHFRALGRFVWPFWLVFCIGTILICYRLFRTGRQRGFWYRVPLLLLLIFSITDLRSTIDWMQGAASSPNELAAAPVAQAVAELPDRLEQYTAILPIPFYNSGSESKDLTFDDKDDWSRKTYQWSAGTGIPLLASKMSRTPVSHAQELMTLVTHDSLSAPLQAALDGRPVLVALHRSLAADSSFRPVNAESPLARGYYLSSLNFAERHSLQPIDSAGPVLFYVWTPPASAARP